MVNFWSSTWCLVFTLVFHCCSCHIRPTTQKTFGPGPGRICNSRSGPSQIWKNRIRCNANFN